MTAAETDKQPKPDPQNTDPGFGVKRNSLRRGTINLPPPNVIHRCKVLCLDAATGKTLWEQTGSRGLAIPIHAKKTNGIRNAGNRWRASGRLFRHDGRLLLRLPASCCGPKIRQPPNEFGWGTGSSPIIFGDKVYIQCDNEEASFLVAIDKTNGQDDLEDQSRRANQLVDTLYLEKQGSHGACDGWWHQIAFV